MLDGMSALLTATDIEVRYNELVVLDRASLTITERDRVGMVGRNGSGKSTFLRIVAGDLKPDGGAITGRRDLVISYLPQQFGLNPTATVLESVREGAQYVLGLIHEFEGLPAQSK